MLPAFSKRNDPPLTAEIEEIRIDKSEENITF